MALCGLSLLTIAALICGLILGMGYLFIALEAILLPLVIAGICAYLLHPIVIFTQKYLKGQVISIIAVLSTFACVLLALMLTIVPPLVKQTGDLIAQREHIYADAVKISATLLEKPLVQQAIDSLYEQSLPPETSPTSSKLAPKSELSYANKVLFILNENTQLIAKYALQWLQSGPQLLSKMTTLVIGSLMVPVFLFYFLLQSEHIAHNWHSILPLRDSRFRVELIETLQEINRYIISFVRGQMIVSLIDGALLGIALKILGLPYAITIAAAAAILGIIPYIGTIITCVPALIIAWFHWQDPVYVCAVAGIFIFVNQFDGWVIQPRIIGQSVGMHDMTIMFSVLFWSIALGGIIGALLAVPLTASLKVIFTRYIWSSLTQNQDSKPNKLSESP